jgi:hypothetical protein
MGVVIHLIGFACQSDNFNGNCCSGIADSFSPKELRRYRSQKQRCQVPFLMILMHAFLRSFLPTCPRSRVRRDVRFSSLFRAANSRT